MKVLVCGGRDFADKKSLTRALLKIHKATPIKIIIHGGARGADAMAGGIARASGIQEVICPANWDKFKKGAGHKRNSAMTILQPDVVVACQGGSGTDDMMNKAQQCGFEVVFVPDTTKEE
jgi:hypothetical protein